MTPLRRINFDILILGLCLFGAPSQAKDLGGRLGFGLTARSFGGLTALSLRFFPSNHVGVTLLGGFSTTEGKSNATLGAKLTRNLFLEENLNCYLGAGGFLLADKTDAAHGTTGYEFDALFGAEFFLFGLPNLGFQFEAGIGARSLGGFTLQTVGGSFAGAGIHYYF